MIRLTTLVAATALIASTATAALAQTPAFVKVADATVLPGLNVTADDLEGMHVYNAAGQRIGEIEDVVGSEATVATGVAIDFDKTSGLGREHRVVPLSGLKQDGLRLVVDLDAAKAAALPVFDD
ncbi:PRC-barrel domain-containing protein [Rhizobium sp. DKSPLA3]|uniref:PRC-barrel domain-containing protein n=1 Tax=Rhizobium quercicola TaxID=2901226 RepID=A0A9X1SZ46_9HYPH|nr:PRC-barrel domain-containing protein [Rhizobium quercicola]MCD7107936.1 PRC-barrel domain-containing protein [Rhizobium quercicola]